MPARRVLAGSALALLMPASLLLTTQPGSAADPSATASANPSVVTSSDRAARRSRAHIQVMPQIVQQGRRTAGSAAARVAVAATVKPRRAGRPVRLQVRRGSGWKTVARARSDRRGRAEFAARATRGGRAAEYRVRVGRSHGLRAATSRPSSTERWLTPSFADEFSGRTLAPVWSHRGRSYEKASKRRCSKGSPKAVKVRGGAARISVIRDRSRSGKCTALKRGKSSGRFAYRLNGHISTENRVAFRYGFAAARIKMHKRRGQHSSFWLQPQTSRPGKPRRAGAEIDVIEYFGDKHPQGGLTSFIHWKRRGHVVKTGSWIKKPRSFLKNKRDGWSKNYHVFSVEWTPRSYVFRIDGKETWRTSKGVSGQPQYPILSLLASDYELSEMKDKQLPQSMSVDWLRIWQA
jgi:beta-glucanase (GH16 family)